MDLRVIIAIGILGILGFLLYPQGIGRFAPINDIEWVAIKETLDNEPIREAKLKKDNPVIKTYDLGFIYRIDRAEIKFSGVPKDYDILTSKIRNAREYERAISTSATSREHFYPIISFPPKEARWIQVVVNDWYEAQPPQISSIRFGARYKRHNSISGVRTKYNPETAFLLYDNIKFESAPKWIGAKRIEKEVKSGNETKREITFEPLGKDELDVTFDLGGLKRVYGIGVTNGGPENNLKLYKISLSLDDNNYQQVYASSELENKTLTDSPIFNKLYQARYVRLNVPSGGWYGKYAEIKEVEIYTDDYRFLEFNEPIENNNASQVFYDDCGTDGNRLAPHIIQGYHFDRGESSDPQIKNSFKPGDEVDPSNSLESRSYCYHYDSVILSYNNLEPDALYWAEVTYLQEKDGRRIQNLLADGFILHDAMVIPQNVSKKFVYPIPPDAYEDGKMNLSFNRIAGPNVVVSEVMIYRARTGKSIPITYQGEKTGTDLFSRAPIVISPIAIDGSINDWSIRYPIVPQRFVNAPYSSPCQLYVQWDADNLYIALRTDRNKLQQIAGSSDVLRSPDTLHLFIDTILESSKNTYKTNNHHIVFSNLGLGTQEKDKNRVTASMVHHYLDSIPKTIENLNDVEVALKIVPAMSEYILEARIPKEKVLKNFSPQQDAIGFNYILSNPYVVERNDSSARAIIKGFQPIFWSAASIDSAPMFWGKLELIGTVSGQPVIMDQNMAKKLTSFNAGDIISLAVIDPDRNSDRTTSETIKVRISGDLTQDSKEITLYETIPPKTEQSSEQIDLSVQAVNDSNFFATRLKTQFGTTPNDDPMILSVQGKEIVTLEYIDPYYGPNKINEKTIYKATAKIGTDGKLQIISRTGRDISIFPAGLRLFLKVQDEDLIRLEGENQIEPAKITVIATSLSDSEEITLIDDKNTGLFFGAIETAYNPTGILNDGILQVIGNEKVRFVYKDTLQASGNTNVIVEASATVGVGSDGKIKIGKSDSGKFDNFFESNNFDAGENPVVIVIDDDLNKDKSAVETVDIKVDGDATKDSINVKLTEIGTDSNTFMGSFRTAYGFKPDTSDDLLEVKGKETIKATYTDIMQANGATMVDIMATAVINTGSDGIVSILKSNYLWDLDNINAGETIYLKVWDPDVNISSQVREQAEVSIISENTHDEEKIILQEKEFDSGVFLGIIKTEFSQQPKLDDKILQVQGGEQITVLYLDGLRLTGEINVPVIDSCKVNVGTTAKMTIYSKDNPYIPISGFPDEGWKKTTKSKENLSIRINDLDVNTNTITVIAKVDGKPEDSVTINLIEEPNNDGIFVGELKIEYAEKKVQGDHKLQVRGGDSISISYIDVISELGQTNLTITSNLIVRKGQNGVLEAKQIKFPDAKPIDNEAEEAIIDSKIKLKELDNISSISAGDPFIIQLVDNDINVNPDAVDYTSVTIKGNTLRDEVQLILTETDINSGIFRGAIKSESATEPNLDDEILQVNEREVIIITYIDEFDSIGRSDIIVSLEITVRTGAMVSLLIVDKDLHKLSNFNAGQRLYFRLDDVFISSLLYKNARISIRSNKTRDVEEIMLEEMPSPGSKRGQGIYIGSIRTGYGTEPLKDGILQVQGGEEIKAIYNSAITDPTIRKAPEQVTDISKVNKGNTGKITIISEDGSKLNNFNIGESIYFRLEDPDENINNLEIDEVEIRVSGEAVAGAKNITLTETKNDSGIFTGKILTCYGRCLIPDDSAKIEITQNTIDIVGGEIITATYFDKLTDTGEPNVKLTDTSRANMIGIATYASDRVIIDGNMSGWPLENALPAGDEGSNLYFQWDADNLYMLAYILDKEINVSDPVKYWENSDALELFIETHPISLINSAESQIRRTNYFTFWFCPKGGRDEGIEPYVGQKEPKVIGNYTEIERAVQIFPNRYILEARIPFKETLAGFNPFETSEEDIIGFNYIIYRSNATQLQWAPTANNVSEKPPSYFGTIIFRK